MTTVTISRFVGLECQIERASRGIARQQAQRPVVELVDGRHQPRGIRLTAKVIEIVEQPSPIVQPPRGFNRRSKIGNLEVLRRRIAHHEKGSVGRPEIRRTHREDIDSLTTVVSTADVVRNADIAVLERLRDDGTDGWRVVHRIDRRLRISPRHEPLVPTTVIRKVVRDRADDVELVSDLRVHRQQIADIQARNGRRDRREDAAIVARRLRLQVIRFHVRRPTGQPQENNRRVLRQFLPITSRFGGGGSPSEEVRQRETTHSQNACTQKLTTRNGASAVTRS